MGNIVEINGNIFEDPEIKDLTIPNVPIVQCISADYATGANFAAQIESRYRIRTSLKIYGKGIYPDCLVVNNIINMVTKQVCNSKPIYETFESALRIVAYYCKTNCIKRITMPRIGSGMDKLEWQKCKEIIQRTFEDINIDIVVYYN